MKNLKLGDKSYTVMQLQKELNLIADGHFGKLTENAVKEYQKKNNLTADGIANKTVLDLLKIYLPTSQNLVEEDYIEAAKSLDCEVACIKAVVKVESGAISFQNGEVTILFEPHVFWRELEIKGIKPENYLPKYSDILYKKYTPGAYGPYKNQWLKMRRAMTINTNCALASASYGKFQIMGNNYKICGYPSVATFVEDMKKSEYYHLLAFVNFCSKTRSNNESLAYWLKNKNWAKFAFGYNGPKYATNNYDTKLAAAYLQYKK